MSVDPKQIGSSVSVPQFYSPLSFASVGISVTNLSHRYQKVLVSSWCRQPTTLCLTTIINIHTAFVVCHCCCERNVCFSAARLMHHVSTTKVLTGYFGPYGLMFKLADKESNNPPLRQPCELTFRRQTSVVLFFC